MLVKNFVGEEYFLLGSYEKSVQLWKKALQETQEKGRRVLKNNSHHNIGRNVFWNAVEFKNNSKVSEYSQLMLEWNT